MENERHLDLSDRYELVCQRSSEHDWWGTYGLFNSFKEAKTKLEEITIEEPRYPYRYMIIRLSHEVVMTDATK
jgi:hypothetical protein